jgi:hypothetical protein
VVTSTKNKIFTYTLINYEWTSNTQCISNTYLHYKNG